jgi:hypothetical protein
MDRDTQKTLLSAGHDAGCFFPRTMG